MKMYVPSLRDYAYIQGGQEHSFTYKKNLYENVTENLQHQNAFENRLNYDLPQFWQK